MTEIVIKFIAQEIPEMTPAELGQAIIGDLLMVLPDGIDLELVSVSEK